MFDVMDVLESAGETPPRQPARRRRYELLSAEQADSGCERSSLARCKRRRGMSGVDDAVDVEGIAAAGDVIEASSDGKVVPE